MTCPRCHTQAHIPLGVYSALNSTTLLFTSKRVSPEKLQQIIAIFKSAKDKGASSDEVARDIRATAPELSSLADVLPKTRPQLYAFIALITLVIQFILSLCQAGNTPQDLSESDVQQIVDEAIERLY